MGKLLLRMQNEQLLTPSTCRLVKYEAVHLDLWVRASTMPQLNVIVLSSNPSDGGIF